MSERGIRYMEGYGLSETISHTHVNPLDRPKPQFLGVPTFDVGRWPGRSSPEEADKLKR